VINEFLARLRVDALLARHVPHTDRRCRLPPALALGVLLRNLLVGRAPVYGLEAWAAPFDPRVLGLTAEQVTQLNDDRVGRALDRLFDADRASLFTEVVVEAVRTFAIDLTQIHNDSTSVTFAGAYLDATGHARRGRRTLTITHGFNKDHRPDLKQLLWILTVSADGAVPIHFRACDGNTTDDQTHLETWTTVRQIVGHADFLYVADSKLCTRPALSHIASANGRFLTVLPRTRREDTWFREWIQTHQPEWVEARRRPNPRRENGPPEVYRVVEAPIRSSEGYRIVWVWSSSKADQDGQARQRSIEKALAAVDTLNARLHGPRCRFRAIATVAEAADAALQETAASRWVEVTVEETTDHSFVQEKRGRPSPHTRYTRRQRQRFHVTATLRTDTIDYDARSDGMFPLLTNDPTLTAAEVLDKYKYQPQLEKRHEQLKTELAVAPVLLKSVVRIEALLTVYFLALLIDALIERELRRAMKRTGLAALPLYPEQRLCRAPTTARVFDLLRDLHRHELLEDERRVIYTFPSELSALQRQVLHLLRVPLSAYGPMG
jgi:transposase